MHYHGERASLLSGTSRVFLDEHCCAIILKLPNKRFHWRSKQNLNELRLLYRKSKSAFSWCLIWLEDIFWAGWRLPLVQLLLCHNYNTWLISPIIIFDRKSGRVSRCCFKARHVSTRCSFWSSVGAQGINLTATLFIPKPSSQITHYSLIVENISRRFMKKSSRIFPTFSSIRELMDVQNKVKINRHVAIFKLNKSFVCVVELGRQHQNMFLII